MLVVRRHRDRALTPSITRAWRPRRALAQAGLCGLCFANEAQLLLGLGTSSHCPSQALSFSSFDH